jgi:hypothetical protein
MEMRGEKMLHQKTRESFGLVAMLPPASKMDERHRK